jgi:hypothetical protein
LTQDPKTREELDGRKSDKRPPDFYDLIVERFNDEKWVPHTEAKPEMHEDYADIVDRPKGKYELTRDKVKEVIGGMKPKLHDIARRYEMSGNGSNQHIEFDPESGEDRQLTIEDPKFGYYYKHIAASKGGDDRKNFLRHESSDLLYWWDVMQTYDLLHFTIAVFKPGHRADSFSTPPMTSISTNKKRRLSISSASNNESLRSDMMALNANVARMTDQAARNFEQNEKIYKQNEITIKQREDKNRTQKKQYLSQLEKEHFEVEMMWADKKSSKSMKDVLDKRLVSLAKSISDLKKELGIRAPSPENSEDEDDDSSN